MCRGSRERHGYTRIHICMHIQLYIHCIQARAYNNTGTSNITPHTHTHTHRHTHTHTYTHTHTIAPGSCISSGNADVRSTHAAIPHGPTSHYVLAWMTTTAVTLQHTDLFPAPKLGTRLAARHHDPRAPADGCEDGQPATKCVEMYSHGGVVIPPTGACCF